MQSATTDAALLEASTNLNETITEFVPYVPIRHVSYDFGVSDRVLQYEPELPDNYPRYTSVYLAGE